MKAWVVYDESAEKVVICAGLFEREEDCQSACDALNSVAYSRYVPLMMNGANCTCDHCGVAFNEVNAKRVGLETLCPFCQEEATGICDECGQVVMLETAVECEDDEILCMHCAAALLDEMED